MELVYETDSMVRLNYVWIPDFLRGTPLDLVKGKLEKKLKEEIRKELEQKGFTVEQLLVQVKHYDLTWRGTNVEVYVWVKALYLPEQGQARFLAVPTAVIVALAITAVIAVIIGVSIYLVHKDYEKYYAVVDYCVANCMKEGKSFTECWKFCHETTKPPPSGGGLEKLLGSVAGILILFLIIELVRRR